MFRVKFSAGGQAGSGMAGNRSHNIVGSPVYYPPNYEINSRRDQANLGTGANYSNAGMV